MRLVVKRAEVCLQREQQEMNGLGRSTGKNLKDNVKLNKSQSAFQGKNQRHLKYDKLHQRKNINN